MVVSDPRPRLIEPTLVDRLRRFPVVVLTGARQTGKTTLVQSFAGAAGRRFLTLGLVSRDAAACVRGGEIQGADQDAEALRRRPWPGSSSRRHRRARGPRPLAGRRNLARGAAAQRPPGLA